MDFRGLRVIQNAYFSLSSYTKQLLLVTFCDMTAGIGNSQVLQDADGRRLMEELTDVNVKIVE